MRYVLSMMRTIEWLRRMILSSRRGFVALLVLACAGSAAGVAADEAEQLARALGLGPGQTVADVGAGDGEWSEALADLVGPEGRVFSTEVEQHLVEKLEDRLRDAGNVRVVLGSDEATGLPVGCCDAILLRLVYHHLAAPEPMIEDLRRALRPRGSIAIIDMVPQGHLSPVPGVSHREGHGVEPEDVVAEMRPHGFRLVARHEQWAGRAERFCLVFARDGAGSPPATSSAPTSAR